MTDELKKKQKNKFGLMDIINLSINKSNELFNIREGRGGVWLFSEQLKSYKEDFQIKLNSFGK